MTIKNNSSIVNILKNIFGFIIISLIFTIIFEITDASPANIILIKDFSATADMELIPFKDIFNILTEGELHNIFTNIFGNILLFMPLGFFLPLIWLNFRKFSRTVIFGAGVSLFIEINQLFNYRATVTDDLILNTLGVILGWLCAKLFLYLYSRFFNNANREDLDVFQRRHILFAVIAAFIPYAIQTVHEAYFFLTQW